MTEDDVWERVQAWWRARAASGLDACVRQDARGSWCRTIAARVCRICYEDDVDVMLDLKPGAHVCDCRGLSEAVHAHCLRDWVAHSGKLVCEICHARYRPPAYARAQDERELRALLDRAAPAALTVTNPTMTTQTEDAAETRTTTKCVVALILLGSIAYTFIRTARLRRQCRAIAETPYLHPLYRRALQLADASGFHDVMERAIEAELV